MRMRTLRNPFNCLQKYTQQSWSEIFPNFCDILDVEVGFGTGSFLEMYAQAHPDRSVVGFEIRKQLVDSAQEKIQALTLQNVHLVLGNAQSCLADMFENNSIDRIFIFHPDPWPKRHHQKRRLVNDQFLEIIHQKLKQNGQMYLATDVPDLWNSMVTTIEASKKFKHFSKDSFWETLYQTRWKAYSLEHNRSLFYETFQAL